jgi:SPX domain protein involved in polyphosphate accumulation
MNEIRQEIDSCATTSSGNSQQQEKMNRIADDISRLEKFSRVNYTGFLKIVKKHDRHTNYILRPMFMVRLNQCPFWKENEDNDALLIKLSELFTKVRGPQEVSSQAAAATTERRTIVKRFFVHTNDVLELKTSVLRHLPVLIYRDPDKTEAEQHIDPPISSLYLDNSDMDAYCSRVESVHHSQIIRLRWYGSVKNNRHISVERRTLEDENRGELKDRFNIKDKHVDGFLHGETSFLEKSVQKMKEGGKSQEEIEAYSELVKGVQQQIMDKHLQPGMKASILFYA